MNTYDSLNVWTNDPVIGEVARQVLAVAEKHKLPATPGQALPQEYDIPFAYRYDPEDDARIQLFRRVAVLFAALDIHCYWIDGKQVLGVPVNAEDPVSRVWATFSEEAMEVVLDFVLRIDLT
ncbi:hypothetical protein PsaNZ64_00505 [Pseudomonas syringae pv. actinidiae]|uniref:hypothetical protein n=1 Tax=Pseudomonas syringae group TaxID=136849 RepID=UPI0006B91FB9|nr:MULTISPECIES: hypothetical protein [Pseudomonas syringae group]KPB36932.1 Uncharacterized protein AC516_3993 [Pseudomonas amygdali pv. sesami]OKS78794.1 hypothetical protein PsaNZ64_00505 [Pseudomonas syringae pv. actinidiae]